MNLFEILLTSVSLSMDAFTISICKGIASKEKNESVFIAGFFGFFQFLMPIIGYYLGNIFTKMIINYNYYLSTILLIAIGILMIKEDKLDVEENTSVKEIIILSFATSIDAFIIGISFSLFKLNINVSAFIIGIITFIVCLIGYYLGKRLNKKVGKYSNLIGGITLIVLGIKLFISNLFS